MSDDIMTGDGGTCAVEDCQNKGSWLAYKVPIAECDNWNDSIKDVVLCWFHAKQMEEETGRGLPITVKVGPSNAVVIQEETEDFVIYER